MIQEGGEHGTKEPEERSQGLTAGVQTSSALSSHHTHYAESKTELLKEQRTAMIVGAARYGAWKAATLSEIKTRLQAGGQAARRYPLHKQMVEKMAENEDFQRRSKRTAAVFIPLCNVHGVASLLFTIRTGKVGSHKGHVSFPGGHTEEGETSVEAAIREFREEVGGAGDIEILGVFHKFQAITGTWVTPVVGFVRDDLADLSTLQPHADEVESLFTLSMQQLTDPELRQTVDLGIRGKNFPSFFGGPQTVWGLTAAITDFLLNEIVLPAVNSTVTQTLAKGQEEEAKL